VDVNRRSYTESDRGGVAEALSHEHGVSAQPGGPKVTCPFCGHETFSVDRENTIGKCWHPNCGKTVHSGQARNPKRAIYGVLERIFKDWHTALLKLAAVPASAYHYCAHERKIDSSVIENSTLGAVPEAYSVLKSFFPALEAAYDDEESSTDQDAAVASNRIEELRTLQAELQDCVNKHAGWLVFFLQDAGGRFVSLKLREPYTKKFRMFKPTKIGGVFNYFFGSEGSSRPTPTKQLLVFEGEFNQLQFASLCSRKARVSGSTFDSIYIPSCAVGGVQSADRETLRRLCHVPTIGYDNDKSGAGEMLVEKLLQVMPLSAFTTPAPHKDLDEFVRSFSNRTEDAYAAVKKLIGAGKFRTRPYDAVRAEVDQVRQKQSKTFKNFEVNRQVAHLLIADLSTRGEFLNDGQCGYFFHTSEKRLVPIQKGALALEQLLSHYGLAASEQLYGFVLDAIRLHGLGHGRFTKVYDFTHYEVSKSLLYIFNFGQQVYRLSSNAIELIDNGADGVLFVHNEKHAAFTYNKSEEEGLFDRLILDGIQFRDEVLSALDRRQLLRIWIYGLFFSELLSTKPILALIGPMGSGKSSELRKIGRVLFGDHFNVMQLATDPKDFDAAMTNEHFVAIDQSDTRVTWLDDRLATAATGGTIKRRDYYTTNRLVEFPIRAFIAMTSRTPHFRREDVADRLILLYVERFREFVPESRLLRILSEKRNAIMTDLLEKLQGVLKALADVEQHYHGNFRLADFASFAMRIAEHEGWGNQMAAILDRLGQEQKCFTAEDEPLIALIDEWLALSDSKNVGRELTSAELRGELEIIAKAGNIDFPYKTTQSFAQALRGTMNTLAAVFDVVERTGSARKRFLSFRHKQVAQAPCADSADNDTSVQ
jgi:hypothetical protein